MNAYTLFNRIGHDYVVICHKMAIADDSDWK